MANRARVIYQSEALYVGTVDATGNHFSASGVGDTKFSSAGCHTHADATGIAGVGGAVRTGIQPLRRVQSANYSFSLNRQDVNQFGQLARVDSVSIEPPTVTLDFSYYLTNGINERLLGFNVNADGQSTSALQDEILLGKIEQTSNPVGKNFFILTSAEGSDAIGSDLSDESDKSVIALGNGFVSNYSIEASVGGMPTANVTVDGLNLKSYTGTADLAIPAIDTIKGTETTGIEFSLPPAVTGLGVYEYDGSFKDGDTDFGQEGISCLRPGDITLELGTAGDAGEFTILPSDPTKAAHIQSFSIDLPISRSVIDRLGSAYGYARVTDFPVNISVQVSAILSELKEGNITDMLFSSDEHDLTITMREPHPSGVGKDALKFTVKGCRLEGESFSSSIGDNKSVDLTFTSQIGGPEDKSNGIFISGSRNALSIDDYYA